MSESNAVLTPDIWETAAKAASQMMGEGGKPLTRAIAEVIATERQRCFKLVLECGNYNGRKNLIYRSDALELIQRGVE